MLFASLVFFICFITALATPPVQIQINNLSGEPIEIFWVNTVDFDIISDDALMKLSTEPVEDGEAVGYSSYFGHKFLVRFAQNRDNIEVTFEKSASDETIDIISNAERTRLRVKYPVPEGITADINTKISLSANACTISGLQNKTEFMSCLATHLAPDFHKLTEKKTRLNTFRDSVSAHLRNYTCADPKMETSVPISQYTYTPVGEGQTPHTVNVFLDRPHSKIWTIDNFVTDEECRVLMEHGRPRLTRATVAAEDGSSVVSENRKANQASWDWRQDSSDPLGPLYIRTLDMANHHTGYGLTTEGQESFTIIQYNVDDQYVAHCDSDCDGSKHHSGGRVATAVLYCKVAEEGGATTFTKSEIFIKPKNGSVTFFSYWGPDGLMDPEGLTEHSGCPVTQGEKWITTFWMREGVNEENPWTVFDPSGIRLMT